jgi:mono/diheme cytochrome c family protein
MTTNTVLISLFSAALSAALLSAQQGQQGVAGNPLATNPSNVANGQRLFNQTCQSCHGAGGQGDRGPALTTPRLVHGNDVS